MCNASERDRSEIVLTQESRALPKPGTKVVRVGPDGAAWIEGFRCDTCVAVVTIPTMACRLCSSRTAPQPFRAVKRGKLFTWSVIHRSYPGVAVPFISAIVDLDDGLSLKGTLRGIEADALRSGMPVALVLDDARGTQDKEGAPYIGFHFVPEGEIA
jgi:uncharacterized OB-fold protein